MHSCQCVMTTFSLCCSGAEVEGSEDDFQGQGPKSRTALFKAFPLHEGDPPTTGTLKRAGFEGKRFYQSWRYQQQRKRLTEAKTEAGKLTYITFNVSSLTQTNTSI